MHNLIYFTFSLLFNLNFLVMVLGSTLAFSGWPITGTILLLIGIIFKIG